MVFIAAIADVKPIYTLTHELQRTVLHLEGSEEAFVAFGQSAHDALRLHEEHQPVRLEAEYFGVLVATGEVSNLTLTLTKA